MSTHHTPHQHGGHAGHAGHGTGYAGHDTGHADPHADPHHLQYGDRLLDDDTANKVYEAQGVVHQAMDGLRHMLQQLPDHDTAALEHLRDTLLYMAGSVGTICGYLEHHTDLPLYTLCYTFNQHAYALIDQWTAEYPHGADAVRHSGQEFFDNFQHQFDSGFIGL